MLGYLPRRRWPSDAAEAAAARDVEPVHTGMARLLGRPQDLFGPIRGGWEGIRDAVVRESGLPVGLLHTIPEALGRISDRVARDLLMPECLPDADPEAVLPGIRTAAARILWGRRGILRSLADAALWDASEAARGGPVRTGLPQRLQNADAGKWKALYRFEASELYRDPLAFEPEPPLPAGQGPR